MWDALTGSTVSVLAGHGVDFTAAQFGSSADIIALGGTDGNVRIWYWYAHGISNTEVFSANIGSIRAVEWSTDRILATGNTGLTVWDRWSGGQLYTEVNVLTKTAIWDAHLSYGSQLVIVGSADVRILDINTGQVIRILAGTVGGSAQFSPDGDYMLVDGVARVWAVQPDNNLPSDYQSLRMLALSRATRSLTCQERKIYLYDIASCNTSTP